MASSGWARVTTFPFTEATTAGVPPTSREEPSVMSAAEATASTVVPLLASWMRVVLFDSSIVISTGTTVQ